MDQIGLYMGIKNDIINYMKSGETDSTNLGIEIEHFVLDNHGRQIPFDIISELIKCVSNVIEAELIHMDGHVVGYVTNEYSVTLEPSCQFEISINPYNDLEKIKEIYNGFYDLWTDIFNNIGYHIETYGMLPIVENKIITPDMIPLSPKKRYKYMDEHFKSTGKAGKYMMRASASAQISVDYMSEEDMIRKLKILEIISPIIMFMMEKKSSEKTYLFDPLKKHLLRIQAWNDLDKARTGFIKHSFDEDFGYESLADIYLNLPLILLTDNGKTINAGNYSIIDLINKKVVGYDMYSPSRKQKILEHAISMSFFHFRVKKYIEIRVADSSDINKVLGYAALIKGLMYGEDSLYRLEMLTSDITGIDEIENAVNSIMKDGSLAVIYDDRTVTEWADILIQIASDNLSDTDKEYLDNVRNICAYCKKNV